MSVFIWLDENTPVDRKGLHRIGSRETIPFCFTDSSSLPFCCSRPAGHRCRYGRAAWERGLGSRPVGLRHVLPAPFTAWALVAAVHCPDRGGALQANHLPQADPTPANSWGYARASCRTARTHLLLGGGGTCFLPSCRGCVMLSAWSLDESSLLSAHRFFL